MPVAWATNRPPAHVLVTEDDQDMRILLGMFLGLHAYQVAEASDGERVFEGCERSDFVLQVPLVLSFST
jgi:DNA-binding response OmpR family regulator